MQFLSSGFNFINILLTAFTHVDPESVRIQSNPQYLFTLLGSTCAKAARRMLMKLTPGGNSLIVRASLKTYLQHIARRIIPLRNIEHLSSSFPFSFSSALKTFHP